MAGLKNLQQIRDEVSAKVLAENLVNNGIDKSKRMQDALNIVPGQQMLLSAQWLQNVLLPTMEKQVGANDETYKEFRKVMDALLWSIYIMNKYERLQLQLQNCQFNETMFRERCILLERELMRYEVTEELMQSDLLKKYQEKILAAASDQLSIPEHLR